MLKTGYLATFIGTLLIEVSEKGLRKIGFVDTPPEALASVPPQELTPYLDQLREYFEGKRQKFDLPIDWEGLPSFQRDVLKLVYTIPFGRTRTYKQIAIYLGNPKATRAVGQANGKNPMPIVIPCHRVIGQKGQLTGYAYGLDTKMKLLELENPKAYHTQMSMFG